jgi:hypothetical protein
MKLLRHRIALDLEGLVIFAYLARLAKGKTFWQNQNVVEAAQ